MELAPCTLVRQVERGNHFYETHRTKTFSSLKCCGRTIHLCLLLKELLDVVDAALDLDGLQLLPNLRQLDLHLVGRLLLTLIS